MQLVNPGGSASYLPAWRTQVGLGGVCIQDSAALNTSRSHPCFDFSSLGPRSLVAGFLNPQPVRVWGAGIRSVSMAVSPEAALFPRGSDWPE